QLPIRTYASFNEQRAQVFVAPARGWLSRALDRGGQDPDGKPQERIPLLGASESITRAEHGVLLLELSAVRGRVDAGPTPEPSDSGLQREPSTQCYVGPRHRHDRGTDPVNPRQGRDAQRHT